MSGQTILEMRNISKYYPGVKALDDVNFQLIEGEVHALIGENGAGKSTLIKIMSGAINQDHGDIFLNGEKVGLLDPRKSEQLGISVIYQEFNLLPYLTVSDNIFLGREKRKRVILDDKTMRKETKKILESLGVEIEPVKRVRELSVAYQQIVEIAKSLSQNAKVLILDEPTAPLTNIEIKKLFDTLKILKKKGVSIIYISHRIEEIFEISDRVTILRDGSYIDTLITKETNRKEMIGLMVGRELNQYYPYSVVEPGAEVLTIENYRNEKIKNISLSLKKGEILGIAGLVGAGRTELARAIFGADKIDNGVIKLNGKQVKILSPLDAIEAGIGLIPEDRKMQGLILGMSVKRNSTLAYLRKISRFTLVNSKKENAIVQDYLTKLSIKCPHDGQLVKFLSGGNQQKVVLAKWLITDSEILIFDEPTRGIDVGAKQEIYELMRRLTKQGKSLIMISSEMPELIGMSDRIIVMHEGEITGILDKRDVTQDAILDLASGGGLNKERVEC